MKWIHFPLHPETPVEGRSLEDLFAGRGVDIPAMFERMKGLMDAEGLPYSNRTHTYNSRLAQEVGKWVEGKPEENAFHDAMFKAYFVDGENLADADVLVKAAESVGLNGAEVREVLESRSHSPAVDADWQKSHQYGVTGVPTFVAGGYGLVGAQAYEMLERLVTQAKEGPPAQ